MTHYNYDGFSTDDYDFDNEDGPAIGTKAPNAFLTDSNGQQKQLLDFEGDYLVLEMGSITCPLFQGRREKMATISEDFENVTSAVLYVREAHPGTQIPSHKNFDAKKACAARLQNEDHENRLILVDDFEGTTHQLYGSMPNAVFIINKNHCVVFRSDWNNPIATRKALKALQENKKITTKSYFRPTTPAILKKTLGRAGEGALIEFLQGFPKLFWNNIIKRNLALFLNKTPNVSGDMNC